MKLLKPSFSALLVEAWSFETRLGNATAFVAIHDSMLYIVTDWHVVYGRDPNDGKLSNKHAAAPNKIRVRHNS